MARKLQAGHGGGMAELRIRNCPEALRKALRLIALNEDKSMNALILEILAKAIASRK